MSKKRQTGSHVLLMLSFLLLLLPVLLSCSQDSTLGDSATSRQLSFCVSSEDDWSATRGTPLSVLSGAFGILGSAYDSWGDGQLPSMMYNEVVQGSGSAWKTSMGYIPEASKTMSFFAYYPYSKDIDEPTNALYMRSGATGVGYPYFDYSVPENVSDQRDLMVAMADGTFGTDANGYIINKSTSEKADIALQFHHLLAGVKFKVNDNFDVGKITRVELTNMAYQGTFVYGVHDPETDAEVFNWTGNPKSTRRTHYAALDFTLTGTGGDTPKELTDVDEVFMLMPQTINTGTVINVTYNNGNKDFVISYKLGQKTKSSPITLTRAKLTTFYLNITSIHKMTVRATVMDWGHGANFDGGVSDQDQIELESILKDWDDEDSEGNSTTTNIKTGARD